MTANQIAYQQMLETQRANKVNEAIKRFQAEEARRTNLANEQLKSEAQSEMRRHNVFSDNMERSKFIANTSYSAINMARDFITGGLTSQGLLKTIFG